MAELRNTLQTDCWEAGGRQLPSYITALTASSADSGGAKGREKARGESREKDVNSNETKRVDEKNRKTEKQIKPGGEGKKVIPHINDSQQESEIPSLTLNTSSEPQMSWEKGMLYLTGCKSVWRLICHYRPAALSALARVNIPVAMEITSHASHT
ncbi:hypothetical protein Q8A73_020558 [Channa argus]|nr:hypothetical protein Q8A73_020558 [Channa argus]